MYAFPLGELVITVVRRFCEHSVDQLPLHAWWFPALILLILGAAAAIDSVKAIVPDMLILPGVLLATALQIMIVSWPYALIKLGYGILSCFLVWLLNAAWFAFFKRDALGMGDAKWTMLAVTCFGAWPLVFAWGIGACLAALWLMAAALMRRGSAYVHFAPFLFIGLLAGIWWLRLRQGVF